MPSDEPSRRHINTEKLNGKILKRPDILARDLGCGSPGGGPRITTANGTCEHGAPSHNGDRSEAADILRKKRQAKLQLRYIGSRPSSLIARAWFPEIIGEDDELPFGLYGKTPKKLIQILDVIEHAEGCDQVERFLRQGKLRRVEISKMGSWELAYAIDGDIARPLGK